MPGTYSGFAVEFETSLGVIERVGASVSVRCRLAGAGSDLAESPLSTNSTGEIAGGSFAAPVAGNIVYFRVENYNGLAASMAQTLT